MQPGQSRGREIIVIDDDSNEFPDDFDSDYGEYDWEDENVNGLEDVVSNDHAAQQDQNPGLGGDAMADPILPHGSPHAINGNQAYGEPRLSTKDECLAQVFMVFPDICPTYLENLYNNRRNELGYGGEADAIVATICENTEQGRPYPKGENVRKGLKRKRELTATEEAHKMYGAIDRNDDTSMQQSAFV